MLHDLVLDCDVEFEREAPPVSENRKFVSEISIEVVLETSTVPVSVVSPDGERPVWEPLIDFVFVTFDDRDGDVEKLIEPVDDTVSDVDNERERERLSAPESELDVERLAVRG